MCAYGFDLGEEEVNGKLKAKNKRIAGESKPAPAYSYIQKR